jgi:molybdate transport system substrate-binding protein
MNKRLRAPIRVALVIAAVLAVPTASFAQVTVIISGGFSAAYREILPEFERTAGIKVTTTSGGSVGSGPNTIGGQIRRGVPADVVILAREGLGDLIAEGRIVAGTDVDLARSIIGMIVRAGTPKPDISTVEALKQTLLRAKSVAMSSSTSGVYLTTILFPRLGIADQMAGKISMSGAAAVGRGEAEIGLQQVSEVLAVPGVDFVGTIPAEVQYVTTYAAAVVTGSKEIEASKRLIAFLSSEGAMAAIKKSGMEPSRLR